MPNETKPQAGAVIEFHPEAFTVHGKKLMGRHSAGSGFLDAHLRYGTQGEHRILVYNREHAGEFTARAKAAGSAKPVCALMPSAMGRIAETGTLFLGAPGLAAHAFQRSLFGAKRWSICGVTHTLLSDRVMDALAAMVPAPVENWDAIVCTSDAARTVVESVFSAEEERLASRLGAKNFTRPLLEKIPLGVHTADFPGAPARRAEARRKVGLAEGEIAVLFVGRLSFHAKAHPAAMDMAVAAAARGRKVAIVEYGIFPNPQIAEAFAEAARGLAPGIRRIVLDGSNHALAADAWACADVFCSLSDNHQETFGLTLPEAMASGLPAVVSDWNGYKDTVRDGVDGFRIRTTAPAPPFGSELAIPYALGTMGYDRYCGTASQFVGVDTAEAAKAFDALFSSAELRLKMGAAGMARAKSEFDWSAIHPRYEALWAELAARRQRAMQTQAPPARSPWPARANPFEVFSCYPTSHVGAGSTIFPGPRPDPAHAETCRGMACFSLAAPFLPPPHGLAEILGKIPGNGIPFGELSASLPPELAAKLVPTLSWCAKIGAVRIA
jgi:glycosyltransferase involved in cell wall biosynthesis